MTAAQIAEFAPLQPQEMANHFAGNMSETGAPEIVQPEVAWFNEVAAMGGTPPMEMARHTYRVPSFRFEDTAHVNHLLNRLHDQKVPQATVDRMFAWYSDWSKENAGRLAEFGKLAASRKR